MSWSLCKHCFGKSSKTQFQVEFSKLQTTGFLSGLSTLFIKLFLWLIPIFFPTATKLPRWTIHNFNSHNTSSIQAIFFLMILLIVLCFLILVCMPSLPIYLDITIIRNNVCQETNVCLWVATTFPKFEGLIFPQKSSDRKVMTILRKKYDRRLFIATFFFHIWLPVKHLRKSTVPLIYGFIPPCFFCILFTVLLLFNSYFEITN